MSVPKPSPLIQESNFSTMARPKKVCIKAWKNKTKKREIIDREKSRGTGGSDEGYYLVYKLKR